MANSDYAASLRRKRERDAHLLRQAGIGVGIMLLTVGAVVWFTQPSGRNSHDYIAEDHSVHAYTMAKRYVTDKLPSPSTADFPWFATRVDTLGRGRYKVVGYVDAQNRYGATIRTNFVCELTTSDGTNWSLVDLAMMSR